MLNVSPEGRAGSYSHVAIAPPVFEKTMALITLPRVSVALLTYPAMTATGSLIVMLTTIDAEPPELLAKMV